MSGSSRKYLIVGGTSKAGTTSIFTYFEKHPGISPSRAKETRFFLDSDYPLPSVKRYEKDGIAAYESFFAEGDDPAKWRLEATPDYLHSRNSARFMREALPCARFVFILREPVDRLRSWFRFGRAMNELPTDLTFERYVQMQMDAVGVEAKALSHPAYAALETGRYSNYLQRFVETFGREAVTVLFYEELARNPLAFVTAICQALKLDAAYFQDYNFEIVNKGVNVRNPKMHRSYISAVEKLRASVRRWPVVRSTLRSLQPLMNRAYARFNVSAERDVQVGPATSRAIASFYRGEVAALRSLVGVEAPWPSLG